MSGTLETLVGGGAFFECPRWHDGRLWVSDFWAQEVLAISPDGTTETVVKVPGPPAGLGWLPDGSLLVVSMMDRTLLRVTGGETVEHAALSAHAAPQGNDMVVDAAGRAYVGTVDFMAFDDMPATILVRVDPDGPSRRRRRRTACCSRTAWRSPRTGRRWSSPSRGVSG